LLFVAVCNKWLADVVQVDIYYALLDVTIVFS